MVDLNQDITEKVRLAYVTPYTATRAVIGINAFLEPFPGPDSEMKLQVIKGRSHSLQEAAADATEAKRGPDQDSKKAEEVTEEGRWEGAWEEDHLVKRVVK